MRVMAENVVEHRIPEPYWHQIGLLLQQLSGLEDGYRGVTGGTPRLKVDPMGLYMLNMVGDLPDLKTMITITFGGSQNSSLLQLRSIIMETGLIKLLPNNSDIFVSHVTAKTNQTTTRLVKQYDLPVKFGGWLNESVPCRKVTFSSVGTPLRLDRNDQLYGKAFPNLKNTVWGFIRRIVANRMARSAQEWADMFRMRNTGTANTQIAIVDWNKFTPGSRDVKDGLLTVVEQTATDVGVVDQTGVLSRQGFWPSDNLPQELFLNASSLTDEVEELVDWFEHHGYSVTDVKATEL